MTKEEVIQNAYGEYWENIKGYVNSDGWCTCIEWFKYIGHKIYFNLNEDVKSHLLIRPKSLKGIEDNNEWIRINSESDLPKKICLCWIIDKDGVMIKEPLRYSPVSNAFYYPNSASYYIYNNCSYYQIIEPPKKLPTY